MSILHVNRSKTKYCVLHNGMIIHRILYLMYLKSTRLFNVPEQATKFLSRKILENIDAGRHYDWFFFLTRICGFSSIIVFGFEYCTVKFPIISFVIPRIISNVIVVGYDLVSETINYSKTISMHLWLLLWLFLSTYCTSLS